ncbi:MAG: diguanylate cyclase [Treponema sp.]|jgi:diguanylate cyclase (GGDEF)-like protein|nr:diguanylate cyclase [Treponema sp.]
MKTKKKNSLLIVDDDKSNLMMLSHILREDYTVRVALDGVSALRIADKFLPDLILLDIIMPDMDGYQVFIALRNVAKTAHIPIIFITGLKNSKDEKKGLTLGAADYISKPFDDMIIKLRVQHQIQIINQMRTIEHLSVMDQLTGIPNRRNFDNQLRAEWGRAMRENIPICLLMIDVDFFKDYNDTYGHQQGDKALCLVARVLTETLKRSADFAARWGGEEFAVLLPNTDSKGGMDIGGRIRENIEAEKLLCDDGKVSRFTVSVGVNTHMPVSGSSLDEFISRADKALYAAKKAGRNRICLYE